ncbi:MAG: HAMP domain-containing sensor histidine kinase [Pseudomonadota bacterium]
MPRLRENEAALGLIAAWLLMALILTALTGGAHSPLAASFLIAPAFAFALGREDVLEIGAAAALAFGVAEVFCEAFALGAGAITIAASFAGLSIAFAAALIAIAAPRVQAEPELSLTRRVAEVSHDLRTPLTHILGFADMIESQVFGPVGERYVEYAGLIRASGNHLLQMVNDVLDLSRLDAGRYEIEFETFDARAIVDEVVRMAEDVAAKKHIELVAHNPDAPLTVSADPRALRRMLTNTVSNAVKFTPEGGRVELAVYASGNNVVFETTDTGPGIPEHERDRLGEAFERGQSGASAEGTGLGLALVRALAAQHGGTLSFHDAPDGGALVRITLPVAV